MLMTLDATLEAYLDAIAAAVEKRRTRYSRLVPDGMAAEIKLAECEQLQRSLRALEHPHAAETKTEQIVDLYDLVACLYGGPARAVYRAPSGRYYVAYTNAAVRSQVIRTARELGVIRPIYPDAPWLDCWRLAERGHSGWHRTTEMDISASGG
jgi:hypothetical protein